MANSSVNDFFIQVEANVDIMKAMQNSKSIDGIVAIAAEHGFELTADAVEKHVFVQPVEDGADLSDDQLSAVAGGTCAGVASSIAEFGTVFARRG